MRPKETWWERSMGELPWVMLRLWWIGAENASALRRVSEERRPSSRLDGGEGEGDREGKDDGGGSESRHGLRRWSSRSPVQSSAHCSWMLGCDKLQPLSSSGEGSIWRKYNKTDVNFTDLIKWRVTSLMAQWGNSNSTYFTSLKHLDRLNQRILKCF